MLRDTLVMLSASDMLILTRRIGESVLIGEHITVTVLGVNGSQVKIGVAAPPNVIVDREEIAEKKRFSRDASPRP